MVWKQLVAMRYENIITCIQEGQLKEQYEKWSKHPKYLVRMILAHEGYFPETLINDPVPSVREAVSNKHPEYLAQLIEDEDTRHPALMTLKKTPNPTAESLLAGLKYTTFQSEKEPYELKLQATRTPSLIEKTMTNAQLYRAKNPLWAKEFTSDQIRQINRLEDCEASEQELEEILQPHLERREIRRKVNKIRERNKQ